MIPKLHKKGTSFRGAAAYVLHDKGRARTSERVSWTETQNLATQNPDVAWRVMAATAMNQAQLKAAAGIKTTGRKSSEHVLHFTLSWRENEAALLTPEEMKRAARGAIAALGADDHQALIVAHRDEPQPHVHVVVNRVSAADGRMLSSSKEKLALSRWAEQYEKDRGRVLCHERVINNAARKRGRFVRGKPDRPRHIVEREAANDNTAKAHRLREDQRKKDHAISLKQREAVARHRADRHRLAADHRGRVIAIRQEAKRAIGLAGQKAIEQFRPALLALHRRQEAERQQFMQREQNFVGRMTNRIKSISFKSLISGEKPRQTVLSDGFHALASAGSRLEQLKERQAAEQRRIVRQQRAAEVAQIRRVRVEEKEQRAENNRRFSIESAELRLKEGMDLAAVRAAWKHRSSERGQVWDTFEREHPSRPPALDLTQESRKVFQPTRDERPVPDRKAEQQRGDTDRGR